MEMACRPFPLDRTYKKTPAGAGASYLDTHREGGLCVYKAELILEAW